MLRRLVLLAPLVVLGACKKKPEPSRPTGPRIVSGVVASDEILWRLGEKAQARVVAVSAMADDDDYNQVAGLWPESLPRLGHEVEQVLALEPTVVILASFSSPEYHAALEPHARVIVLEDFDGFAAHKANVRLIASAVGMPERGREMVRAFEARRSAIAKGAPMDRPTCISWGSGFVAGGRTTFDDSAKTAGCNNVAADTGLVGHKEVDAEQLVLWDPDFVVISCASDCGEATAAFAQAPGMGSLAAVKAGHVIAVPTPVLASVGEGMLDLAQQLQSRITVAAP